MAQKYADEGETGLISARSVPHNHPQKTPPEVVEKVFKIAKRKRESDVHHHRQSDDFK